MKKKLKIIANFFWVIFLWTMAGFLVQNNFLGLPSLWDSILDIIIIASVSLASMGAIIDITDNI